MHLWRSQSRSGQLGSRRFLLTQPLCRHTTDNAKSQTQAQPLTEQETATYAPPKPNTGSTKPADTLSYALKPIKCADEALGHDTTDAPMAEEPHRETEPAPPQSDDAPEDPNVGKPKPDGTLGFSLSTQPNGDQVTPPSYAPEKPNTGNGKASDTLGFSR